jgi:hypothetical protein
MFRHTSLVVLVFSIAAVLIGIYVLPGKQPQVVHFPWQIETMDDGATRVFGLTLGHTTLSETERAFGEPAEVSLFVPQKGQRVVEAYFDSVDISGLRARVVIVMDIPREDIEAMYNRGARVANMGGGQRKVTLSDEDMARLQQMPIGSLTYIPRINLDAELISRRFGEPAERIAEPEGRVEHWLYPEKGLDIALDAEGKEVLQYVLPARFDAVRQPLLVQQERAGSKAAGSEEGREER